MTVLGPAERAVLLAFADDEHLMGQRHTEWIGVAPFLEEDLAFASIGQDELGHAAMLYELVISDLSGDTPSAAAVDALAFRREPADYRSCWLVEAACTEWASALVRHWLYDTAEALRWRELAGSSEERLRAIAGRATSEERYHLRHADALLDALVGDADAGARIANALAELLPLGMALFDDPQGADIPSESVVGRSLAALA
ncbi:MAG TPA: 1,2-phenylacetyl-CoA epoxidase subunit PaaC, partial [Ilumatobacter sp.]